MKQRIWPRRNRALATLVVAVAGAGFALVRIPTTLGVKVPGMVDLYGITSYDKSGKDAIWRVWWRARDQIFHTHRQWAISAILASLLVIFVASALACVWFALAIPVPESDAVAE